MSWSRIRILLCADVLSEVSVLTPVEVLCHRIRVTAQRVTPITSPGSGSGSARFNRGIDGALHVSGIGRIDVTYR